LPATFVTVNAPTESPTCGPLVISAEAEAAIAATHAIAIMKLALYID
jgi:hypothetical protein